MKRGGGAVMISRTTAPLSNFTGVEMQNYANDLSESEVQNLVNYRKHVMKRLQREQARLVEADTELCQCKNGNVHTYFHQEYCKFREES